MGYDTRIYNWDIAFVDKQKYEDFLESIKIADPDIIGFCPLIDKRDYDIHQKEGETKLEVYFHLEGEGCHWYEIEKWIPFLAKYLIGSFEASGEMDDDQWKVEFAGDGTYKYYEAYIEYREAELRD